MGIASHRVPRLRKIYLLALLIVVVTGVLSRIIPTGNLILDKYLGDALYAVMGYLFLRLAQPTTKLSKHFWVSMAVVTMIETFQLTGIPLSMRENENGIAKLISIALGTKFGIGDLVAYAVGLSGIYVGDTQLVKGYRS